MTVHKIVAGAPRNELRTMGLFVVCKLPEAAVAPREGPRARGVVFCLQCNVKPLELQ